MSRLVLAGCLVAAGTAWLALARPIDQGDDPAAPLIKLNVVAIDSHGQPVADLTREDFQVFDNGKLQGLASFRRNDVKPLRVAPPAPNEYSNRSGVPLSRATVVLFDLLNARFDDRAYALSRLIPALQHVESPDSLFLYILTMDGTLYPVHPLPDPETTAAPGAAAPWTGGVKPLLDAASVRLFHLRPLGLVVDDRIRMTYGALEALAKRVAETHGRKSIIWISHGMPISIGGRAGDSGEIDYTPLLQRLTATLDRANVAVYTVRQPGSLAPGAANGHVEDGPTSGMASTETLEQFAGLTGGRSYGTVDIAGAIAQAAADARMSYLLAFAPQLDKWDGKYHKIRVACSRKGVRLQTKQGYYAFASDAPEGDQEKAAIETAISSPFDIPEIGLYAGLVPSANPPGGMLVKVRIDAADVHLPRQGDVFAGQLAVGFAGYLPDGSTEASATGTFAPRLSPGQREQALQQGLPLTRLVTPSPGIRKIRVVVYDRDTGAIGSLTVPVPPPAANL